MDQSDFNAQEDLLKIETEDLTSYEYASQGQRFLNLLIDNLFMRFALSYATGFAVGSILQLIAPDFLTKIAYADGSLTFEIVVLSLILGYFNYILYYTFCEKLFKGYTLGKLITGTRAIQQDGQELTFKNAILRSLCRCVPFEVFSGFGILTWHDQWTDTMVVKSR